MKKTLFSCLLALLTLTAIGQSKKTIEMLKTIEGQWTVNDDMLLIYQEVFEVESSDINTLYTRAKTYISSTHPNADLTSDYPNKGSISFADTLKGVHKTVIDFCVAPYELKIDCKDSKVRLTLTFDRLEDFVRGSVSPVIYQMKDVYPANPDVSLNKNATAKIFYGTHNMSLTFLQDVKTYMQGPKDNDW